MTVLIISADVHTVNINKVEYSVQQTVLLPPSLCPPAFYTYTWYMNIYLKLRRSELYCKFLSLFLSQIKKRNKVINDKFFLSNDVLIFTYVAQIKRSMW